MKLSDYRETFYKFSEKASDVARHLSFAGIALVWIFKIDAMPIPKVPDALLLPAALLALSLALDVLQYVGATCVWGIFQWWHERKLDDLSQDPELESPSFLKWPQFIFFVGKLVTLTGAYFFLTRYIWIIWWQSGNSGMAT
jgi:hypothetical protein